MSLYISAIISGIAVGGIYALVAVGITQVFTVTRVLNFAQAGFGLWGAYLYAVLTVEQGWPVVLAAVVVIALTGVMGVLSEILIFRYASKATTVNKIIMTFGLLTFLTALATRIWSREIKTAVPLMPRGGFSIADTSVSWQQLANLVAVVVVVAGMTAFLRYTRLGLQTRAMAEDITVAELMGTRRNRIGMLNWGLAAMVGSLSGVLAASLMPFQSNVFIGYFLFALIATLLGGLRSLTWTAVGGLLLGVIQSVSQVASNRIGIGSLAIFLSVVALVLLRRNWPSELAKIGWSKPQISGGSRWWLVNRAAFAVGWLWLIGVAIGSDFWGQTGAMILVYTVASFSLVPLIGWTGQVSLAQAGFMAVGAGAMHEMYTHHGFPLAVSLAVAIAAGALAGATVGLIAYRLSFVQTAIITLAFTGVVSAYLLYSPWLHIAGGRLNVVAPSFLDSGRSMFVGFAVATAAVLVVLANIRRSQWGIAFISVRTAPGMTRHFGLRPSVVRISAFTLSGAVAAVAGVMYILLVGTTNAPTFGVGLALQVLLFAVAGGTGSLSGPLIGAFGLLALPQALNLSQFGSTAIPDMLGGLAIIQLMASRPDGLLSLLRRPAATEAAGTRSRFPMGIGPRRSLRAGAVPAGAPEPVAPVAPVAPVVATHEL